MGNASSRPVLPDSRALFNSDLPKFVMQTKYGKHGMIGDGKFMKSYLMRVDGTNVIVKVYMKLSDEDLNAVQKRLHQIWILLSPSKYPNLLPYQMWIRSQTTYGARQTKVAMTPIYLIRQYLASNLHDRLLTRPFLTDIEKFWLIFQLFHCIEIAHSQDVIHGDIKPENVLCTGWNCLVLTDFAPHKPTYIPSDDPTDFKYFFESSGRRSCYVAPERFVPRNELENLAGIRSGKIRPAKNGENESERERRDSSNESGSGEGNGNGLTFAMDIFSLGCTIAEVYLDSSTALFDLPTMLSYVVSKDGAPAPDGIDKLEGQIKSTLSRIDNECLHEVVVHMTQKDPRKRLRVDEYKLALQGKKGLATENQKSPSLTKPAASLFPPYFEKLLMPLFFRLHYEGETPDRRLHLLCESYTELVRVITGIDDSERHETLQKILETTSDASVLRARRSKSAGLGLGVSSAYGREPSEIRQKEVQENRERYMKAALLPSTKTSSKNYSDERQENAGTLDSRCRAFMTGLKGIDEVNSHDSSSTAKEGGAGADADARPLEDPYKDFFEMTADRKVRSEMKDEGRRTFSGIVILVQLVTSNLRHLQSPRCKVVSILLLLRFACLSEDDVILKRILPSLLNATEDTLNSHVCSLALRAVASSLSLVNEITSTNEDIFPTYIVPAINRALRVNDNLVRMSFANTVGLLAESGKRFLERAHFDAQQRAISSHPSDRAGPSNQQAASALATASSGSGTLSSSTSFDELSSMSLQPNVQEGPVLVNFQYTRRLQDLRETVAQWVKVVLSDLSVQGEMRKGSGLSSSGTLIKRELLQGIERLCIFFGQEMVISVLLPHLLTFFSDHDWELRLAFWKHIPTVCAFVGATLTEAYVLPGIDHGLVDCEESVVIGAIKCLDSLCKMKLLAVPALLNTVDPSRASALLLHPSEPIRVATIALLTSVAEYLGPVDTSIFLIPLIQKFFRKDLSTLGVFAPESLGEAVRRPLDQMTFRNGVVSRHQALADKRPMPSAPESILAAEEMHEGNKEDTAIHDDSREDDKKERDVALTLMAPYMEHAAIELHTKVSQWRYALHGSLYTSPYAAALRRCTAVSSNYSSAGTLDALLNLSASAQFTTQSLNTLIVPHQKFGPGFYYPLTEEQRSMCTKLDSIRDPDAICALYGMGSSRYEAEKVLTSGNKDTLLLDEEASASDDRSAGAIALLPPSSSSSTTTSSFRNNSGVIVENDTLTMENEKKVSTVHRGQDAASSASSHRASLLKKKIRALGIPPLPPDVGSLLQPQLTDDKRLQYYNGYTEALAVMPSGNAGSTGQGSNMAPISGTATVLGTSSLGEDGAIASSSFGAVLSGAGGATARDASVNGRVSWRPKEGTLMATLREHNGPVNRIAVCPDQSFFGSVSSDGTVKIWQLRGMDWQVNVRSSLTYKRHHSPVTDITVIENSHSMATCSADGTIHVWRVDLDGKAQLTSTSVVDDAGVSVGVGGGGGGDVGARAQGLGVAGMGVLKVISPEEGAVEALQHFNGDVASVLAYATRQGGVHGWDLRSSRDAFYFDVRPELGSSTAMTLAPDRSWTIVGTSRGFLLLWDLRYNVLCKLWRHSSRGPIRRLACCKSLRQAVNSTQFPTSSPALADTEGSYLFVAAGDNELAIFGLPEAGECLKCFRSIPLSKSREKISPLPFLEDVPLPRSPGAFISSAFDSPGRNPDTGSLRDHSVRAMVGRTPSFLVTAGSDSMIRYWDYSSPTKCFTVAGLMPGQPKTIYEASTDEGMLGRLFLSFDSTIPSAETTLPQHLPLRSGRGPIVPSTAFKDAILDLKSVDLPTKALISSAKDGTIKLWGG